MPKGNPGIPKSKEHNRKNSEAKKGKSWEVSMGKEKAEEMRKHLSQKMKIFYKEHPEARKKISIFFKNFYKKYPEEKAKSKLGREKYLKKHPNHMRDIRKNTIIPKKDTSIEVKIQNFLKELNIEFFTHQYMKIEHGYQCDIFIPSMNLIIECDGDYWHKYPVGNDIDHLRTKELIEKGFKVLRLWENEIKVMNLNNLKEILNERK